MKLADSGVRIELELRVLVGQILESTGRRIGKRAFLVACIVQQADVTLLGGREARLEIIDALIGGLEAGA